MIFFSALITVMVLIPIICKIADKAGFVDKPVGRKQHDSPVPPMGGAVIFSVFLIFMMVFGNMHWAVYVSLALILVVGIIDDAFEVNAKIKFAIHFMAAFILVIGGGVQIHSLGNLLGFGDINLGWMAIPFSVACVVYIQNAVNMMDGVDGLAGGNSLLIFGWVFAAAFIGNHEIAYFQLPLLMVCLLGFLIFNMRTPLLKRAKIFLGDAGSMALGLMIAWAAITLSQDQNAVIKPVSVAWILALPIVDSFGLLVARLKEKRPAFEADRRHFHHHFAHAGFSPNLTTPLILVYSFVLCAVGFFGIMIGIPEYILGWGWICLWVGHAILTLKSEKFIQLLQSVRLKFSY
jgi:UDP-GlcNAc:undecaprenyl-phosphate GlcNAc-1-phosphate transferase